MGLAAESLRVSPPGDQYVSYADGAKPDAFAVEKSIERLNKKVKWLAVRRFGHAWGFGACGCWRAHRLHTAACSAACALPRS